MWFEIMTGLQFALINTPELTGIPVVMGAEAKVPKKTTVILVRGRFQPKTNDRQSINEQIIQVQCWVHDKESTEAGYAKLAELEKNVHKATNTFGTTCFDGKRLKIRLKEAEPDGDAFRPSVGSQTAVSIQWQ